MTEYSETERRAAQQALLMQRPPRAPGVALVGGVAAALLMTAWWQREESDLVAYEGTGYALGVAGLAMMTLLLAYSARKHIRALQSAGPIRLWFHIHMSLGLLGPTAIILHSNFELGSLNARVALASMLVVAGSGIVGRFLYTRIHFGMAGSRATLPQLRLSLESRRALLAQGAESFARTAPSLARLESSLDPASEGRPLHALRSALLAGRRARRARRELRVWISKDLTTGRDAREIERAALAYVDALRRACGFSVYARAFSIWHALHLPFCALLFAAAAVHVLAVHLY